MYQPQTSFASAVIELNKVYRHALKHPYNCLRYCAQWYFYIKLSLWIAEHHSAETDILCWWRQMDLAESFVSSCGSRVAGSCPGGLDAAQRKKLKGEGIYQMSGHVLEVILFDMDKLWGWTRTWKLALAFLGLLRFDTTLVAPNIMHNTKKSCSSWPLLGNQARTSECKD